MLTLTVPPAAEPLSVAEAKGYLRVQPALPRCPRP